MSDGPDYGSPDGFSFPPGIEFVQHDNGPSLTEPTLEFEDSDSVSWRVVDDVTNQRVQVEAFAAAGIGPGVSLEVLYLDSRAGAGPVSALSGTVLAAGVTYLVSVEGTFAEVNQVIDLGSPEPDAMFPSSTAGRVSTTVELDAETVFASWHGEAGPFPPPAYHSANTFKISLDGGATYAHLEPIGGPYSSPTKGHLYRYALTGQGQVAGFRIPDTIAVDNYGKLRITIQQPGGTGTGSGTGSLLPPADASNNGQVLAVVAGLPVWTPVDGGTA